MSTGEQDGHVQSGKHVPNTPSREGDANIIQYIIQSNHSIGGYMHANLVNVIIVKTQNFSS